MGDLRERARGLEEAGRELGEVVARLRRLAEAEEMRALAAAGAGGLSAAQVRAAQAARRLWRETIGQSEGDPAKALLLELLARRLEGRPIGLSALGDAAGLAPTTATRWIARLHVQGLIARRQHATDQRTILIDLTDEADDRLRAWFAGAMRVSGWAGRAFHPL